MSSVKLSMQNIDTKNDKEILAIISCLSMVELHANTDIHRYK